MLQQVIALVLPLLLWGAVSGVLNLILTRKSQIEAWVNANPRLAAWSKFLRSVGFDPWALHAWATLLVSKKLPAAQQADSDVAKLEQAKADAGKPTHFGPLLVLLFVAVAMSQQACSAFRSVTPADRAEAYAGQAKAAELACKAYTFDLAAGLTPDVPAMTKLCAGE